MLMVVFIIWSGVPRPSFAAENPMDAVQGSTESSQGFSSIEDSEEKDTTEANGMVPSVEASEETLSEEATKQEEGLEQEDLQANDVDIDRNTNVQSPENVTEENEEALEMMGSTTPFIPRLSAPSTDSLYYYSDDNPFYKYGYGMPNCTCYAWGRAYEILGSKPNLSIYDANTFWTVNLARKAYAYGSTPKLGAIACWQNSSNTSGHVAVVEKIEGDQVTVSESSWSGFLFRTDTYTIGCEDAKYPYVFQGYIYLGDFVAISDTTAPTITNVAISEEDQLGFTVSCTVSDDQGVTRVQYPAWTEENGQDDIQWNAGKLDGNTASYRVLYSDHNNEKGTYMVHIYAYDAAGNKTVVGIEMTPDTTAPSVENIHITNKDAYGFTVTCTVSDDQAVTQVQYPTWTQENGQDDLQWYVGSLEGNQASCRVLYSDHNDEKDQYMVHIYAYDAAGNCGFNSISVDIAKTPTSYAGNTALSKAPADAYGNVDGENGINSADALQVLQYTVALTDFSAYSDQSFAKIKANVSGDLDSSGEPKITSVDALEILQRSVGIINVFPVEE